MGLSTTHIGRPDRRDRLLLLAAMAHTLLSLLVAATERAGLDRLWKANTSKRRVNSLYRQGLFTYQALPNMPNDRFERLMIAYNQVLREHLYLSRLLGVL